MNPVHLAKAIVHWLEFERLCERGKLITEASLKFPLHNYLSATTGTVVELEVPIPGLPANAGRKKESACAGLLTRAPAHRKPESADRRKPASSLPPALAR